jgi:NADP-dependent 3-hydroxy acid dehydrogenase YdfG
MTGALAGRVALVTGASSGIGESAAVALGAAGASVVVTARRLDRLEALVQSIEAAGGRAHALPGDVARESWRKVLSPTR